MWQLLSLQGTSAMYECVCVHLHVKPGVLEAPRQHTLEAPPDARTHTHTHYHSFFFSRTLPLCHPARSCLLAQWRCTTRKCSLTSPYEREEKRERAGERRQGHRPPPTHTHAHLQPPPTPPHSHCALPPTHPSPCFLCAYCRDPPSSPPRSADIQKELHRSSLFKKKGQGGTVRHHFPPLPAAAASAAVAVCCCCCL
jgi:hypothetical protein